MRLNEPIKIIEQSFDMSTGFPTPVETVLYNPCFANVNFTDGAIETEQEQKRSLRRIEITIRYRVLPNSLLIEYRGVKYSVDSSLPNIERTFITLTGVVYNGS